MLIWRTSHFSGSGSIPAETNGFFFFSFLIRLVGLVLPFVEVRKTSFPIRQACYIDVQCLNLNQAWKGSLPILSDMKTT